MTTITAVTIEAATQQVVNKIATPLAARIQRHFSNLDIDKFDTMVGEISKLITPQVTEFMENRESRGCSGDFPINTVLRHSFPACGHVFAFAYSGDKEIIQGFFAHSIVIDVAIDNAKKEVVSAAAFENGVLIKEIRFDKPSEPQAAIDALSKKTFNAIIDSLRSALSSIDLADFLEVEKWIKPIVDQRVAAFMRGRPVRDYELRAEVVPRVSTPSNTSREIQVDAWVKEGVLVRTLFSTVVTTRAGHVVSIREETYGKPKNDGIDTSPEKEPAAESWIAPSVTDLLQQVPYQSIHRDLPKQASLDFEAELQKFLNLIDGQLPSNEEKEMVATLGNLLSYARVAEIHRMPEQVPVPKTENSDLDSAIAQVLETTHVQLAYENMSETMKRDFEVVLRKCFEGVEKLDATGGATSNMARYLSGLLACMSIAGIDPLQPVEKEDTLEPDVVEVKDALSFHKVLSEAPDVLTVRNRLPILQLPAFDKMIAEVANHHAHLATREYPNAEIHARLDLTPVLDFDVLPPPLVGGRLYITMSEYDHEVEGTTIITLQAAGEYSFSAFIVTNFDDES